MHYNRKGRDGPPTRKTHTGKCAESWMVISIFGGGGGATVERSLCTGGEVTNTAAKRLAYMYVVEGNKGGNA